MVLAVLVRFPFAARPRALPVLVDLYRSEADDLARGRPRRTPAQVLCGLLRLLLVGVPGRRFVFAGDSAFGTHEVARFCRRHRSRLTLVSKPYPDANLFDPPGPYGGVGRPPAKGARRAKPSQASGPDARRDELTVDWYGGGTRQVDVVGEPAHWFKSGRGLVAPRWVSVHDRTGTHRDEYLYATDPTLTPAQIVGDYCGRWNLEKTQADCPLSRRWVGTGRIGHYRRDGVARVGRVVPATSGRSHRRNRMPDATRRPVPPRA